MKSLLKRLVCYALIVATLVGFSPLQAEAAVSYESKKTVYLPLGYTNGTAYLYYSNFAKNEKITKVTSSKPGVAKVNSHTSYETVDYSSNQSVSWGGSVNLYTSKPGTTKITTKTTNGTYNTTLTVKKAVNPVKTLKISGSKNLASSFNKSSYAYGKYFTKDTKGNVYVEAKSGWYVQRVAVYSSNSTYNSKDQTSRGSSNSEYIYCYNGKKSKLTLKDFTFKANTYYSIDLTLVNKKDGGYQYLYYYINRSN